MGTRRTRSRALVEVTIVFAAVVLAFKLIDRQFPASPGSLRIAYLVVPAIPVLLALLRGGWRSYGLDPRPVGPQLRVAAVGALPVLVVSLALFRVGWASWPATLLLVALQLAILLLLGRLLRVDGAPWLRSSRAAAALLFLPIVQDNGPFALVSSVFASLILVAWGEEALFRGYIQSRLNDAYGRPFRFFGIPFGWGLLLSALFFGVWHWLAPWQLGAAGFAPAWMWGAWTMVMGLIFGFARERSNGVLAGSIWHALINL